MTSIKGNMSISVIIDSTRQGRFSEEPAQWILPPTGKRMDAPCCDVFRLVNGKIQSFDCYPSGTVIFAQLGVLSNIEAAIAHS